MSFKLKVLVGRGEREEKVHADIYIGDRMARHPLYVNKLSITVAAISP